MLEVLYDSHESHTSVNNYNVISNYIQILEVLYESHESHTSVNNYNVISNYVKILEVLYDSLESHTSINNYNVISNYVQISKVLSHCFFYKPIAKKHLDFINTMFCFNCIFVEQIFVDVEVNV